jgi:hypothetical protein
MAELQLILADQKFRYNDRQRTLDLWSTFAAPSGAAISF